MGKVKDFFEDINVFKKHFSPAIRDFINKPPISRQFQEIRDNITDGSDPVIICDRISSVLQDSLYGYYNKMELDLYRNLFDDIVKSIENCFSNIFQIWKDNNLYLKDLDEIWIACEPMLDLVNDKQGSFDLLIKQLVCAKRVKYFLTKENLHLFYELKNLLIKNRCVDLNKLTVIEIKTKLEQPVVIYFIKDKTYAFRGQFHPEFQEEKCTQGFYKLKDNLPIDWMTKLNDYWTPRAVSEIKYLCIN